ncbi:MAG: hypothetical protein GY807_08145 [Gammaproteobacteria bacterium]|nr:hypothetical protein [Gammaproteobacteria bacterium]
MIARICLFLLIIISSAGFTANTASAKYFTIEFVCENHNRFLQTKEIKIGRGGFNKFYPYVVASLNLYGRLEGRDQTEVGAFKYNEQWGHYRNRPLFMLKPESVEGSRNFQLNLDDKCPTGNKRKYIRSIFSEKDDLYLSLLVVDKPIKGSGPGRAVIAALVGIAIKAGTTGLIDINQDITDFIDLAETDFDALGHSIADLYDPQNGIAKSTLKTVPLEVDLGVFSIDDGTVFQVPFTIIEIESMANVQGVFSDKGSVLENVKTYLHIDAKNVLQTFFSTKLSADLFNKEWKEFKKESVAADLKKQCEVFRERVQLDLSVLTDADRTIAFAEFLNQQGLENPHLKKYCMGDNWFNATEGTQFQELLQTSLNASSENPFSAILPDPTQPSVTGSSLSKIWLERENVESRLNWLIRAFKQASSAGDGVVNNLANNASQYASSPVKLRDTTGSLRDDIFASKVALDDLVYLVSSAARKKKKTIEVLGCFLNYRQLNDAEITEDDWHWQYFGKWKGEETAESDFFLLRVKFDNKKRGARGGAEFSEITFLNISESSLYDLTNVHKERGTPFKKTTCGSSKYPVGKTYAELY